MAPTSLGRPPTRGNSLAVLLTPSAQRVPGTRLVFMSIKSCSYTNESRTSSRWHERLVDVPGLSVFETHERFCRSKIVSKWFTPTHLNRYTYENIPLRCSSCSFESILASHHFSLVPGLALPLCTHNLATIYGRPVSVASSLFFLYHHKARDLLKKGVRVIIVCTQQQHIQARVSILSSLRLPSL